MPATPTFAPAAALPDRVRGLWTRVPGLGPRPDLPRVPDAALPIAFRLALLYLMLPLAIWLLSWFRWWVGWPLTALLGVSLGPALAGPWRGRLRPAIWGLLAVALICVLLTAAGSAFNFRYDWFKHRALLLDLGRYPWPVFLPDPLAVHVPGPLPLLRYYLGWYLVPGLAARLWGPGALQWAVPLWTWAGLALILLLFTHRQRGRRAAAAAALLLGFSGLDVLRVWLDPWLGIFLTVEPPMHALLRAPQHFLPAGLYVLLLWHLRRQPRFLAVSGVLLAAAPLWSALGAVGLLPLAAALVGTNGLRPFLRWPNLILAGPLAGLALLYLTADVRTDAAGALARGWLWEQHDWTHLARALPVIYLIEFLLPVGLLLCARPALRREPFFLASLATLLLLPLYFFGFYNDLAIRGTMPAVLVLACLCADILTAPARTWRLQRPWARVGLAGALAAGALYPLWDLARGLQDWQPFRYADAALTTLADPSGPLPMETWQFRQYVAFARPPALDALLQAPPRSRHPLSAATEPVARDRVGVHWDGRGVIYAQAACRWLETRPAPFLQVRPARFSDFEPAQLFYPLNPAKLGYGRQRGEACGWRWVLPSYPFAVVSFRTGQAGRWETELFFDAAGALTRTAYRDARALRAVYRALAAAPPDAYAFFDVRLVPDALALTRADCTDADLAASFFLHVVPFESADLPPARQSDGFAVRNFPFAAVGSRIDDRCWATLPLPAYGIRTLRLGQFTAQGEIWRVDIPFAQHEPAALAALRTAYRAAAAQPPALRAVFDVHVIDRRVTFVKTPCRAADVEAKFILHATPRHRRHLPRERRRAGFVNLDFPLEGYGALFDGACLARTVLPAYPLARLRVGQFLSREQRVLWQGEIPLSPAAASGKQGHATAWTHR